MSKILKSSTSPPGPLSKGEGEKVPGYLTTDSVMWFNLKENVKKHRKHPTEAEETLWETIRNNKLGYKFRRQHVISNYITDFVCLSKKLIIEVDGEIHKYQKQQDRERTHKLNAQGYRIIRFKNEEIKNDIKIVIKKIIEELS